ncbi:MAG: phenylacetate--CoA ligase family protein [Alicyclobacillus shizuokensis]|nr:phenylacetate--CoA ligase family protein [Alicyclobacillus shizuokensis]
MGQSVFQREIDLDVKLRRQVHYVLEHSEFYRKKFHEAGLAADSIRGLQDLPKIPFTHKDELRASQQQAPPLGLHAAVSLDEVIRVHSSSGTTGRPTYVGVTRRDNEIWREIGARVMAANGIHKGSRVAFAMGLSFFVGSAVRDAIEHLGATFIPIGTGESERLVRTIRDLGADVLLCTPSYAFYLADYVRKQWNLEPRDLGVKIISTGGEPGGGLPEIRQRIEEDWGCRVVEAMGNADMAPVLFGECLEQRGMHFLAGDYVHCELINPDTGEALEWADGAEGELVYTALERECVPLLRFRTRDRVRVETSPCLCGRTEFRVRCIGRTDDMLIIRGVNVFPSAIRDVVNRFSPRTTGNLQILLRQPPPLVQPPLPLVIEYSEQVSSKDIPSLRRELETALRKELIFAAEVELVPAGSLPQYEMKARLIRKCYE